MNFDGIVNFIVQVFYHGKEAIHFSRYNLVKIFLILSNFELTVNKIV